MTTELEHKEAKKIVIMGLAHSGAIKSYLTRDVNHTLQYYETSDMTNSIITAINAAMNATRGLISNFYPLLFIISTGEYNKYN